MEELLDPTPGPNQVVMHVKYSVICGINVHAFLYDLAQPGAVREYEYTTGAIVDVGANVTQWKTGVRVGADAVLNPLNGDLEARVVELTGGAGPKWFSSAGLLHPRLNRPWTGRPAVGR